MKKIIFSILAFFIAINLHAAVPGTITYQGVLTDGSGALVGDGNYDITFKLYDALTNGNLLWTEVHNLGNQVAVTNGVFSTELGGITTFASASLDFSIPYYLDITVGATHLTPRILFNAAGYAQNSKNVISGTITGSTISGGTINNTEIGGTTPAAGSFTTLKMTTGAGSGKVLTSDGSGNASWNNASGGATIIQSSIANQALNLTLSPFAVRQVHTVTGAQIGNAVIVNITNLIPIDDPYTNNFISVMGWVSDTDEVTVQIGDFGASLNQSVDYIITVIKP